MGREIWGRWASSSMCAGPGTARPNSGLRRDAWRTTRAVAEAAGHFAARTVHAHRRHTTNTHRPRTEWSGTFGNARTCDSRTRCPFASRAHRPKPRILLTRRDKLSASWLVHAGCTVGISLFRLWHLRPRPLLADKQSTQGPVRARTYFTLSDDGLVLPWRGTVFINPPYGREIGCRYHVTAGDYLPPHSLR